MFSHFHLRRQAGFFLLLISGFIASDLAAGEDDLKLYQATSQQTIVDFKLNGFRLDTLRAGAGPGKIWLRPLCTQGLSLAQKGAPDLPVRVFTIGVPAGAQLEATVLPVRVEEMQNIEVPPVPETRRNEDSFLYEYKLDENIFTRNAFYPEANVMIDPPAQFRQQTIVRVQFSPMQYNPATKVLRIVQEARLVVRYTGGQTAAVTPRLNSEIEESFYRNLILNYTPARAFRAPVSASLNKNTASLAATTLYKFPITKEGIYRITGQTLASEGLPGVASDQIRLYNNGGRELPRVLSRPRPEGLVENAIYVSDGGDGRLEANDFILFYGRGVEGFAFDSTTGRSSHYLNHFGFNNYYWLSVDPIAGAPPAKRMNLKATLSPTGLTPATTFQDQLFNEEESNVWLESDQTWFGHLFTNAGNTSSRRYRFQLTDPVTEVSDTLRVEFYGPTVSGFSSRTHVLGISFNGQDQGEYAFFGRSSGRQSFNVPLRGGSKNGENEVLVNYTGENDLARLYMDDLEFRYQRHLRLAGSLLLFDGRKGVAPAAYSLDNVNPQDLWLFDVSDFSNVSRLNSDNWQVSGSQLLFADATHPRVPRRYLAANSAAFTNIEAVLIDRDAPSNLRSNQNAADMIVITHDDFVPAAQRLESLRENWHNGNSNQRMAVEVVNIQDVFDEFSCGLYDPVAVRDFLRYAYLNWQVRPTYVVLLGDGDYDPKNIIVKTDKNWIPTYHTDELDAGSELSRVTDSWFTYLTGGDNDKVMDLAIGRIPVRSLTEAQAYLDKLIKYETAPDFGPWRNTVVAVADDEFGSGGNVSGFERVHIEDTEKLMTFHTPKYFDIKKVYLTEFAAVQSASISGIRKPSASETLLRLLNQGSLLVNYIGHGNPTVWSHERVLELSTDFDRIQNGARQAVWVAATCTFGKFDMPDRQSFAEQLLLVAQRGAIAVLATTRDVFANYNALLNQAYYDNLFGDNQVSAPLGLTMVRARTQTLNSGSLVNDEKFHLYGDPSMRLAIPPYSAELSSPDTIKALSVIRVRGAIKRNGQLLPNFNGKVRLEAFDTERFVRYISSVNYDPYYLPGNSLFRGEAPVVNGQFEVQFIAPKDLTYGGSRGRFTAYFWNDTTDGNGFRESLKIGGSTTNLSDQRGPEIQIGFAGAQNFTSGGYVGLNPVLEATFFDSLSGINLAGEIGHKITLEIDGNSSDKIDVTDFFSYNSGSYTRGSLRYMLENLSEGRHTVEVKAWDNFNNSNTGAVEFVVASQAQLQLFNVMNYPNPLRQNTSFTFELNQPDAEVEIKIYTLAGRMIRKLEPVQALAGFNMVGWDGYDADGDRPANGVYLYKISARRPTSETGGTLRAEEIGKLVIQR